MAGGDVSASGEKIIYVLDKLNKVPGLNKEPTFQTISLVTRFSVKVSGMFLDEKDALYSLRFNIAKKSNSFYYTNS